MVADGGEIRYAEHRGAHLAYRMWGDGPPLLYAPSQFIPITAMDEEPAYERFLARLASFATVIAFDRTGIGLSDPMRDNPTVEDWAAQLESVLDAAGFHSSFVLGHAWGGLASVTLAATHPERGAGARHGGRLGRNAGWLRGRRGARDRATVGPVHVTRFALSPLAGACGRRRVPPLVGERRPAGASPAVAQQLLAFQVSADVTALIPKVHVPTLVIDRPDAPRSWASDTPFGADIDGARVIEVAGVDLLLWLPDSEAVVAEIEDFLTGERRPRRSTGSCSP